MFRYFESHMAETLILPIAIILLVFYAAIVALLIRGFKTPAALHAGHSITFSIIIAARNEGKSISTLLDSLSRLEYPPDRFEIVIVNDRSTDATLSILEQHRSSLNNVRIISLSENPTDMPNKKYALQRAITEAQNDVLAFTDADCIVPPRWLQELSKYFADDVGLVAGYSPYVFEQSRRWNSFLRYEEYKVSLIAASAIGAGRGFLCTGRNLAYRKRLFDEVGGFEKIKHSVSGDDDLFLQLVRSATTWKIRYMTGSEGNVATFPPTSWTQFVNQRTRHISASRYYLPDVAFAYGISHLLLLASIAALFISPFAGLLLIILRLNIDAIVLAHGKATIHEEIGVADFFINECLLALYTLTIGPLGYIKKFNWKGSTA
jgi:cellulose synthase/poly-beta-1,6-N-acetylglucosamine synthase-like glycosyltransferase